MPIGIYQAVKMYTEHIGMSPEEMTSYHVVGSKEKGSKRRDKVEVTFGVGQAYTRVAEFVFTGNMEHVRFNSVPSKTRLHVSADKLMTGMKFQKDGEWYLAKAEDGESIAGLQEGNPPATIALLPWDIIEVTCYYVSKEGSYVGDKLMASVAETRYIAGLLGVGLADLVNGCKFDMLEALVGYARLKEEQDGA